MYTCSSISALSINSSFQHDCKKKSWIFCIRKTSHISLSALSAKNIFLFLFRSWLLAWICIFLRMNWFEVFLGWELQCLPYQRCSPHVHPSMKGYDYNYMYNLRLSPDLLPNKKNWIFFLDFKFFFFILFWNFFLHFSPNFFAFCLIFFFLFVSIFLVFFPNIFFLAFYILLFFSFHHFFLSFRIFFHIFLQCFLFMYFPCFCTVERFFFFRQFLGKKSGLSQCTQVLYYCTTKMTHKLQFSWKLSMHYKKS